LANRLADAGGALDTALELARAIASFPQGCMRSDRLSCYEQWALPMAEAVRNEFRHGMAVLRSGASAAGARKFASGAGRHGQPS
jgi:enoyl-CoA hydratase